MRVCSWETVNGNTCGLGVTSIVHTHDGFCGRECNRNRPFCHPYQPSTESGVIVIRAEVGDQTLATAEALLQKVLKDTGFKLIVDTEATRGMHARFSETMRRIVEEKLRQIDVNREALVVAWVAETGLLPSESVLVQTQSKDGTYRTHVEKR